MALTRERLAEIVEQHRIFYAIILALLVAMLLTAVSMALYVSSGASRLDLSRPGYESLRDEVQQGGDESTFSSTGPINSGVADDFQQRFDKHRDTLSKLGDYSSRALDDQQLQIAPTAQ